MRVGRFLLVLVLAGALGPRAGASGFPDAASAESARDGAAYLATRQGANGSVPDGATPNRVAEAVVALVAGAGQDAAVGNALERLAQKAETFLTGGATNDNQKGPYAGMVVSGLVAAGEDPRHFAEFDFVAFLASRYNPATGSYGSTGTTLYGDGIAMLGVLAADAALPDGAVTRLQLNQCPDGGWGWQIGCVAGADTDTTAVAMSVLATKLGGAAEEVRDARQWLLNTQHEGSGCWALTPEGAHNANSCGLAISAVVALGERPDEAPWTDGARTPVATLRDLQVASGGFKLYASSTNADDYATIQAVPALAGWAYPVSPPPPPGPSPSVPATRSANGSGSASSPTDAGSSATARTNGEEGGAVAPGSAGEGDRPPDVAGDGRRSGGTRVLGVSLRAVDALMGGSQRRGTPGSRVAISPTSASPTGNAAPATWVVVATLAWAGAAGGWTWRRWSVNRRSA